VTEFTFLNVTVRLYGVLIAAVKYQECMATIEPVRIGSNSMSSYISRETRKKRKCVIQY